MILKTLTHDHGDADCWNWYDNIESASAYYNEESGVSCVELKFKGAQNLITLVLSEAAYLCNDDGQTIEKLYPAEHFSKNGKNKKQQQYPRIYDI